MSLAVRTFTLVCVFLFTVGLLPATTLYVNAPGAQGWDGSTDAWNIADFAVSNSFALSGAGTARGAGFLVWLLPGSAISAVDWSIGSDKFLSDLGSGTATVSSTPYTGVPNPNGSGFNLVWAAIGFPDVSLSAGTYWFTLTHAVDPTQTFAAFWDQNDGPSEAWQSTSGQLPAGNGCVGGAQTCTGSETFLISDTQNPGQPGGEVPEPSTYALVGGGLALAALLRRKLA